MIAGSRFSQLLTVVRIEDLLCSGMGCLQRFPVNPMMGLARFDFKRQNVAMKEPQNRVFFGDVIKVELVGVGNQDD